LDTVLKLLHICFRFLHPLFVCSHGGKSGLLIMEFFNGGGCNGSGTN
jgi:hypothetical protein